MLAGVLSKPYVLTPSVRVRSWAGPFFLALRTGVAGMKSLRRSRSHRLIVERLFLLVQTRNHQAWPPLGPLRFAAGDCRFVLALGLVPLLLKRCVRAVVALHLPAPDRQHEGFDDQIRLETLVDGVAVGVHCRMGILIPDPDVPAAERLAFEHNER